MIGMAQEMATQEPALATERDSHAEEKFAALVARQARFVFRVAYSVLRNAHDAEDAVQDVFLKLYRSRSWEAIENENGFLARAAWRVAIDRRRGARTQEPVAEMAAGGASPEQAAIAADRVALVHRLMDALPEELRLPLALSGLEEMTSQQIAGILEIPEATVRTRLMRARQILKQKLAAYAR
jgi:RNA polymerase sigma-70 factor, ECF subfamily